MKSQNQLPFHTMKTAFAAKSFIDFSSCSVCVVNHRHIGRRFDLFTTGFFLKILHSNLQPCQCQKYQNLTVTKLTKYVDNSSDKFKTKQFSTWNPSGCPDSQCSSFQAPPSLHIQCPSLSWSDPPSKKCCPFQWWSFRTSLTVFCSFWDVIDTKWPRTNW